MLLPIHEQEIIQSSQYSTIVGIDEAGRGAWAGPVAVGYFAYTLSHKTLDFINDSKQVNALKRQNIYLQIQNTNDEQGVLLTSAAEIDKLGIGIAIQNSIDSIIKLFNPNNTYFIIDGQFSKNFGVNTIKKNKADSTYYSVAMASILAKVTRDNLISKLSGYEEYGFAQNKGYGTAFHAQVIHKIGLSDIHRHSYKLKNGTLK